jgi:hypothetical protein
MRILQRTWAWLRRWSALVLLIVTLSGLVAGGLARLAGAGAVADAAWVATAACGIGYALWPSRRPRCLTAGRGVHLTAPAGGRLAR